MYGKSQSFYVCAFAKAQQIRVAQLDLIYESIYDMIHVCLWIYVCVLGPVDHWWSPARPPNLETLIAQKILDLKFSKQVGRSARTWSWRPLLRTCPFDPFRLACYGRFWNYVLARLVWQMQDIGHFRIRLASAGRNEGVAGRCHVKNDKWQPSR